jgi:gag-polypeptide of LTR copia-type
MSNTTTSSKFAYKAIPQFNPIYYRAWAADAHDTFAERKWLHYLLTPGAKDESATISSDTTSTSTEQQEQQTSSPVFNAEIAVQAKAFLNQSIPYEHKAGIESCTTAAEIWLAFQQRYASQSREDELRLEGQLLDFKKLATDTIDQHITKFDTLIASIVAQQPLNQRYDDTKKNQYFLRTLETAQIPGEDWKGFITFLGKSWLSISTHALFAEARTYYNTHIQPYTTSTTAAIPEPSVLKTYSDDLRQPRNNWQTRSNNS